MGATFAKLNSIEIMHRHHANASVGRFGSESVMLLGQDAGEISTLNGLVIWGHGTLAKQGLGSQMLGVLLIAANFGPA